MTSGDRTQGLLAIDPGERRYGVAFADLETRFARPLEVIDAATTDPLPRILELTREQGVVKIVVGRPIGLSGAEGPAVAARSSFVERLRAATDIEIIEHDERLTTVIAEQGLRASGSRSRARAGVRDAVAAQVLLQSYLDAQR